MARAGPLQGSPDCSREASAARGEGRTIMVLSPEIAYDGVAPFPGTGRTPCTAVGRARAGVTVAIVVLPFAGLAAAMWLAWGHRPAGQLRRLAHAHLGC